MIVDTSALVAVFRREVGYERLLETLISIRAALPAPALVEFHRVTAVAGNAPHPEAVAFLSRLLASHLEIEVFTNEDARLAVAANEQYGTGNRRGGTLNLLDLMVYAMAKRTGRPILCTGRDFAATDIAIHPASRLS